MSLERVDGARQGTKKILFKFEDTTFFPGVGMNKRTGIRCHATNGAIRRIWERNELALTNERLWRALHARINNEACLTTNDHALTCEEGFPMTINIPIAYIYYDDFPSKSRSERKVVPSASQTNVGSLPSEMDLSDRPPTIKATHITMVFEICKGDT